MLRFPYIREPITRPAPPSLPSGAKAHWRPLVPIKISTGGGISVHYQRALLDTGSQDTLFPLDAATLVGVKLLPQTPHIARWRGIALPLRFGEIDFHLEASGIAVRWSAIVGFASGMPRYPILGSIGFLQYFDVAFLGGDRVVEMLPIDSFPGAIDVDGD